MSKYGAKKIVFQGITFDSQKEAQRYAELRLLERGKVISDLHCQVKFELIPRQIKFDPIAQQNGENGRVIERAVNYIADFVYTDNKTGQMVVEDTKGYKTKEYIIKRKLMLHKYGIRIREV